MNLLVISTEICQSTHTRTRSLSAAITKQSKKERKKNENKGEIKYTSAMIVTYGLVHIKRLSSQ